MLRTKIDKGFRVTIPESLRPALHVGEELLISMDQSGRILLVPESKVVEILERTAGMWAGRQDIPADGIHYVNQIRSGRRLHAIMEGNPDERD
jgi:bifunctional DNA-binding transcriptional regulator/antitoxin component of YhaV-PrlF toxin-antitoxin module